jgi:hypothetical protein
MHPNPHQIKISRNTGKNPRDVTRLGLKYCGTKTMNTGEYIPITVLVVLTLTLIEAAGAAEYRKLPGIDQKQQFSAKIMQVCNSLIKNYIFDLNSLRS